MRPSALRFTRLTRIWDYLFGDNATSSRRRPTTQLQLSTLEERVNPSPYVYLPGPAPFAASGEIDVAGDVDFFGFDVVAGDLISINVKDANGGSFDSIIGLFDPQGNLVAFDDDSGTGSVWAAGLTFTADQTGEWSLAVTHWQGGTYNFDGSDTSPFNPGPNQYAVEIELTRQGNQAPVATPASFNIPHDTQLNDYVGGTDANNDALTFAVATQPQFGTVQMDESGAFIYTPNAGYVGTDSFTFLASDGTVSSTPATVSIEVTNEVPMAEDSAETVVQDSVLTSNLIATDADDDPLTYSLLWDAENGTVEIDPNTGEFTYTPNEGFVGEDFFLYVVNDGVADSEFGMVVIEVTDADPLVWIDEVTDQVAAEGNTDGGSFVVKRSGGDTSMPLEVLFTHLGSADAGIDYSLWLNGVDVTNGFTFAADETEVTIELRALTDALLEGDEYAEVGITESEDYDIDEDFASAEILIKDNDVSAADDTATTDEDSPATIGVMGNDSGGTTVTSVTQPEHGTATISQDGQSVIYTPTANFTGTDSFIYTMTDGNGHTATANVTVTVNALNDPPVAFDDWYVMLGDSGPLVIDVDMGVLQNDTDAEGDPLEATRLTGVGPFHGTLEFAADGSFIYTPDTGFVGADSFTYFAYDGTTNSIEAATVKIYVQSPTNPPFLVKLDVNDNGDANDEVDDLETYLPGYEGDEAKISSFENEEFVYTGQRMRIVVEGIGTANGNVAEIRFEITDVSSHAGYNTNGSDAAIIGENKEDDYSFAEGENQRTITITPVTVAAEGGEMEANQTWATFWAKDYGGGARVNVTVVYEDESTDEDDIVVPVDSDRDGIADAYEKQMLQEWKDQYGEGENFDVNDLKFFNDKSDKEKKDPDGDAVWQVEQADAGDAHTALDEFRGFNLSGGGVTANETVLAPKPGAYKLSFARKEVLLEVDQQNGADQSAPVLNKIPRYTLTDLFNGAGAVFSQEYFGAGIHMYYYFDQKVAVQLPNKKEALPKTLAQLRGNAANAVLDGALKNHFIHFLLLKTGLQQVLGSDAGSIDELGNPPLDQRGILYAIDQVLNLAETTTLTRPRPNDDFPLGPLDLALADALETTLAHEVTHMLIRARQANKPGFDGRPEHTKDPNQDGRDGDKDDLKDLMYWYISRWNRQFTKVKFHDVVRVEIDVKGNAALKR